MEDQITPQRKLELVQGMLQAKNVTEYARRMGVDRSYLYELRREMEQVLLDAWARKTVGRPADTPPDPEVERLKAELVELDEKAKVWEVNARVSNFILEKLESVGAVKKTSDHQPIFLRQ
jgi:transposase-like protein